jgi:hypothetical protein
LKSKITGYYNNNKKTTLRSLVVEKAKRPDTLTPEKNPTRLAYKKNLFINLENELVTGVLPYGVLAADAKDLSCGPLTGVSPILPPPPTTRPPPPASVRSCTLRWQAEQMNRSFFLVRPTQAAWCCREHTQQLK